MLENKDAKDFFDLVKRRYPNGSVKSPFSIEIGDVTMHVLFFPFERIVSFGLFFLERRYSRKTILIDEKGFLSEDMVGFIPKQDLTENEPNFEGFSITRIVEMVRKTLSESQ